MKNKAILFMLGLLTNDVDKLIEIKKIKKIKAQPFDQLLQEWGISQQGNL